MRTENAGTEAANEKAGEMDLPLQKPDHLENCDDHDCY